MPLIGRSTALVDVITWHHCYSSFTGCLLPERVEFKLCVLVCPLCAWTGPVSRDLTLMADVHSCQRLRSAAGTSLPVPATRRRTLGDRAFPVAGNALPLNVTYARSLYFFRRLLWRRIFSIGNTVLKLRTLFRGLKVSNTNTTLILARWTERNTQAPTGASWLLVLQLRRCPT